MPTVLRFDGLRVVIYPNDHQPAHVHVIGDGLEAIFSLASDDGRPELIENFGFRTRDVARISASLAEAREHLAAEWRRIHGG